jgi:hypothetical protein
MSTITVTQSEERKGLKIHAVVTLCVIALLTAINLTLCPGFLWFFFPLAGMSIGLAIHYFGVRKAQ